MSALLLAAWCAGAHAAALDSARLTSFLSGLAATPVGPVPFVEQRMSALLAAPLELQGELTIDAEGNIDKRILQPTQERVRISAGSLVIEQRGRTRTLSLAHDRRWRDFHLGVMGLLNREPTALAAVFDVTLEQAADDWTLRLVPKSRQGRGGVAAIIASGRGPQLSTLRIEQSADEWQEMRFERTRR